jgi:hypothetical protein
VAEDWILSLPGQQNSIWSLQEMTAPLALQAFLSLFKLHSNMQLAMPSQLLTQI